MIAELLRSRSTGHFVRMSIVLCVFAAGPAVGQEIQLPYVVNLQVSGVEVALPLEATLTPRADGQPIPFRLTADLSDATGKVDAMVVAAGLDNPTGDSDFSYRGTLAAIEGNRLWVKYHFKFELSDFLSSDGSVEGRLAVQTDGRTINFVAQDFDLNVSNDLVRGAVEALDLDDAFTTTLQEKANGFLLGPQGQLALPAALDGADIAFDGAEFATVGGRPALTATGTLRITPALFIQLISQVGGKW